MPRYDTSRLTAEEMRAWRLAKLFDLRAFIGVLFVIFGVILLITGFGTGQAEIDRAAGMNLALWVGGVMLVTGIWFLVWLAWKPPEPITAEEAARARREAEEMGTSGGHH